MTAADNTKQHSTAQHSIPQYNTTQCNTAKCNSTTQPKTAQHSTCNAKHSAAQNNTAQHNTTAQKSTTQQKLTGRSARRTEGEEESLDGVVVCGHFQQRYCLHKVLQSCKQQGKKNFKPQKKKKKNQKKSGNVNLFCKNHGRESNQVKYFLIPFKGKCGCRI